MYVGGVMLLRNIPFVGEVRSSTSYHLSGKITVT